uniref:Cysteine protease n=1 Tax=Theropithecus gelada TaxID=9565 RepID=A0A8D2FND9_THEGE
MSCGLSWTVSSSGPCPLLSPLVSPSWVSAGPWAPYGSGWRDRLLPPGTCAQLPAPPQHCFMMPQSLGVIGGKPNSAHYFIGYVGEELIYLDPHTTQPAVEPTGSCFIPDESFHCQHPPCRMSIAELDPSIAVVRGGLLSTQARIPSRLVLNAVWE